MSRGRVVVAMSGGVDSSVAAALLVEQGYEAIGLMARLWAAESPAEAPPSENRCCPTAAMEDARRVAAGLGIPFYLLNLEAQFKSGVVDAFVAAYAEGRTPNPCIACNELVRFGALLRHALALGAEYLATGHYARIEAGAGSYRLRRAADARKDQSYMLYALGQEALARVFFPIGALTKEQVRSIARERGLAVAERAESMDLCFAGEGGYRRFLEAHAPWSVQAGPILDTAGREIGRHRGIALYTVGQRRGIGLAAGDPLYVVRLDRERNAVVVGPAAALERRTLRLAEVRYPDGVPPETPARVVVRIRYHAEPAPATWTAPAAGLAEVTFDHPVRGVAPGQSAVAYCGEMVFGGGIIRE